MDLKSAWAAIDYKTNDIVYKSKIQNSSMLISLSSQTVLAEKIISLVASDMDGTLTRHGKFTSSLLKALEELSRWGILTHHYLFDH